MKKIVPAKRCVDCGDLRELKEFKYHSGRCKRCYSLDSTYNNYRRNGTQLECTLSADTVALARKYSHLTVAEDYADEVI